MRNWSDKLSYGENTTYKFGHECAYMVSHARTRTNHFLAVTKLIVCERKTQASLAANKTCNQNQTVELLNKIVNTCE